MGVDSVSLVVCFFKRRRAGKGGRCTLPPPAVFFQNEKQKGKKSKNSESGAYEFHKYRRFLLWSSCTLVVVGSIAVQPLPPRFLCVGCVWFVWSACFGFEPSPLSLLASPLARASRIRCTHAQHTAARSSTYIHCPPQPLCFCSTLDGAGALHLRKADGQNETKNAQPQPPKSQRPDPHNIQRRLDCSLLSTRAPAGSCALVPPCQTRNTAAALHKATARQAVLLLPRSSRLAG